MLPNKICHFSVQVKLFCNAPCYFSDILCNLFRFMSWFMVCVDCIEPHNVSCLVNIGYLILYNLWE